MKYYVILCQTCQGEIYMRLLPLQISDSNVRRWFPDGYFGPKFVSAHHDNIRKRQIMPILKPLHPPPDGDVSRGPALVIVCAVFGAIATVSTALRLGVRAISHKLGCDDLMIAIATALLIVQTVLTGLVFQNGGGRHQYYLKPEEIKPALKWNYITEILLFLIIPFTKISICFFVLRIKNTGWLKWLLYGVIAGLIITTLVPIVILLAQCRPIRAFWDKTAGTCWDPRILNDVNYFQVGK